MNTATTMTESKNTATDALDKAKTTGSKVADELKSTSSAIGSEARNFLADLEDLVSNKISGNIELSKIKHDISAHLADYKASIEAAGQQVVTQAKQKAEGVNTYVHDEPWKAIGVGFAMGLLLGVVVSRR